jgi:hypothetical protein
VNSSIAVVLSSEANTSGRKINKVGGEGAERIRKGEGGEKKGEGGEKKGEGGEKKEERGKSHT